METTSVHRETNTSDCYPQSQPISIIIAIRFIRHYQQIHILIPSRLSTSSMLRGTERSLYTAPAAYFTLPTESGITTKGPFIRQSGNTATNWNSHRCFDCARTSTQNSSSGWNCKIVGGALETFTSTTIKVCHFDFVAARQGNHRRHREHRHSKADDSSFPVMV